MLPRRLVSFLSEFQVLLVVKLSKIGENPENSRKIFVFEANKTAKAKNFSEKFYIVRKRNSIAKKLAATWMVWDEKVSRKQALKFTNAEGCHGIFKLSLQKNP